MALAKGGAQANQMALAGEAPASAMPMSTGQRMAPGMVAPPSQTGGGSQTGGPPSPPVQAPGIPSPQGQGLQASDPTQQLIKDRQASQNAQLPIQPPGPMQVDPTKVAGSATYQPPPQPPPTIPAGQKVPDGMIAIPQPQTSQDLQNARDELLKQLQAKQTTAEQLVDHHPSVAKKILAAVAGGLVGAGDPKLGMQVARGIRDSGPEQKAYNIASQRAQTAQQKYDVISATEKQQADIQRVRAQIIGEGYKSQHEQASTAEQLALANYHRLQTDPAWLKIQAGITNDADVAKFKAEHPQSLEQEALDTFNRETQATKGRPPTSEELVGLNNSMKSAKNVSEFDSWVQAFQRENKRSPTTAEINEENQKLKEKPPVINTASADRAVQAAFNQYETNFRSRVKEYSDTRDKAVQGISSLDAKDPAMDRAAIEQTLGLISRRIGQQGIEYLAGGRTKWLDFKAKLNEWNPNPWAPVLPDAQREQLRQMLVKYQNWEENHLKTISDNGLKASTADSPAEIRRLEAETEKELSRSIVPMAVSPPSVSQPSKPSQPAQGTQPSQPLESPPPGAKINKPFIPQ